MPGVRVLIGKLLLIGRVNLGVELDGFDTQASQAQCFRAIAALTAGTFDLQAARERVQVVLQNDDAPHDSAIGIEQRDAAFEQKW